MNQIGQQLMQESKADVTNGKTSWTRRDLLSLLLRANVSGDLPPSQRMSDADVLSRELCLCQINKRALFIRNQ